MVTFTLPFLTSILLTLPVFAFEGRFFFSQHQPYSAPPGQQTFTNYSSANSWVVPIGVTSISVVTIGAGGGGGYGGLTSALQPVGGGGGGLAYVNNISVTPGETLTIEVGAPGEGTQWFPNCSTRPYTPGTAGGTSRVRRGAAVLVEATGGAGGSNSGAANGGCNTVGSGGCGGEGGLPPTTYGGGRPPGGGGGAAGYSGNGGNGATHNDRASGKCWSGAGAGGGAGGGTTYCPNYNMTGGAGGNGGFVGWGGEGSSGAAKYTDGNSGGSNWGPSDGNIGSTEYGSGNDLGGGGGGGAGQHPSVSTSCWWSNNGHPGGVRIIWPGDLRQFPSTRTADE